MHHIPLASILKDCIMPTKNSLNYAFSVSYLLLSIFNLKLGSGFFGEL